MKYSCFFCHLHHRNQKAPPRRRPRRIAKRLQQRGDYAHFHECRSPRHLGRCAALHVQAWAHRPDRKGRPGDYFITCRSYRPGHGFEERTGPT